MRGAKAGVSPPRRSPPCMCMYIYIEVKYYMEVVLSFRIGVNTFWFEFCKASPGVGVDDGGVCRQGTSVRRFEGSWSWLAVALVDGRGGWPGLVVGGCSGLWY